ncbi:MAG: YdiU family protein [Gammaproteobacteria bacterium]|nr:MAG: YdiU family protein [Gammaproteobacteria bacterium]
MKTGAPLPDLCFDNAWVRELPTDPEMAVYPRQVQRALHSMVKPTPVAEPRLVAHSAEVAEILGFGEDGVRSRHFADVFAGNALMPGMQPMATNYGGHQFGNWASQLGDGRAISLGEVVNDSGRRLELQLKGAGITPYSRFADGRAVMRSSIREFLCSEAMHHLGVPTTRALCLVATGESVERDMFYDGNPKPEPGAVLCRVAPSFTRFGHFELPAARGDIGLLETLVDFTIRRDFPRLVGTAQQKRADWFAAVCGQTAELVAHWMRVGFVHGVLNTDNMSILGLTIDYGPYGWLDNFDPDWTPNTTDRQHRRYRFGQQPRIAHWNLACLAQALAPLFGEIEPLQEGLRRHAERYSACERRDIAGKLGLLECRDEDVDLMQWLHLLMTSAEIDMTMFFRRLSDVAAGDLAAEAFSDAFYDEAKRGRMQGELEAWLMRYRQRLAEDERSDAARCQAMRAVNPKFVLRNWLAQMAIDQAQAGDESEIHRLLEVMRRPYDEQPGMESYCARRPDWARQRAGCSMLSCSS